MASGPFQPYIPIPGTRLGGRAGTNEEPDAWWRPNSPFAQHLSEFMFINAGNNRQFWSRKLEGVSLWEWFVSTFAERKLLRHAAWAMGSSELMSHLAHTGYSDRVIIAHSHALQVVLYACARGLKVKTLISIGSPIRGDMANVACRARPNIGYWLQVSSNWTDYIQVLGGLLDGAFGIRRVARWRDGKRTVSADCTLKIPGVAHSKLLTDASCFKVWAAEGLLDVLSAR